MNRLRAVGTGAATWEESYDSRTGLRVRTETAARRVLAPWKGGPCQDKARQSPQPPHATGRQGDACGLWTVCLALALLW